MKKKSAVKKKAVRRGRPPKPKLDKQTMQESVEQVKADSVLKEAASHMKQRASVYDNKKGGERSMEKTVQVFNAYYGLGITEAMGWHFMSILKKVRQLSSNDYHADSAEDRVAYTALEAEAHAKESEQR